MIHCNNSICFKNYQFNHYNQYHQEHTQLTSGVKQLHNNTFICKNLKIIMNFKTQKMISELS